MATSNDVVFLENLLNEKKPLDAPGLDDDRFFELFVCDQTLKDYELDQDELLSGAIGGADDGGIDGFFTFVNGELIQEDTSLDHFKRGVVLDVFLIQAKRRESFQELVFDKVSASLAQLLDFGSTIDSLTKLFRSELLRQTRLFRTTYEILAKNHPAVNVTFVYGSKGATSDINEKVQQKGAHLCLQIKDLLYNASAGVIYRY